MMNDRALAPLFAAPEPDTTPATLPPPAIDQAEPGPDIFARASVLQLQFRRLGTSRKVSTDAIDVKADSYTTDRAVDKRLIRVSKEILDSAELKAIEKHDGETARYIDARKSGPAFANQGGFHLIANAMKPEIDEWIAGREMERADLVAAFVDVYDERCRETDNRLGTLAPKDRPTRAEARDSFGLTVRWMTFGYTDANAARAWQSEALAECRLALRVAFADVVNHLAERLTPGEEGKPKTFRDSLVEKFDDFVRSFRARDIADDRELAALVDQARALMSGVSAADLRKKDGLRQAVATRIQEIKTAIDPLVVDVPTRGYFDE